MLVIVKRELASTWRRASQATLVDAPTTRPTPTIVRRIDATRDHADALALPEGIRCGGESLIEPSRRRFSRLMRRAPA
jgi:hypothetical protein